MIFPLGSTVVIKDTVKNTQAFLQGHTDSVSTLALSPDGTLLASGQETSMGYKASIMLWDVAAAIANGNTSVTEGELLHELSLHKGRIQDLAFSHDGALLASLGGADDNNLVIWDTASGSPVCGSPAATHAAATVTFFNNSSDQLLTSGHYHIRRWDLDLTRRRLYPTDVAIGVIKRSINCLALSDDDCTAWCGTRSGDILEIDVLNGRFVRASTHRFSLGVLSVAFVPGGAGSPHDFVVAGNGDGSLVRLSTAKLSVSKAVQLLGGVTSITLSPDRSQFLAGTNDGNRYLVDVEAFETPELRGTAHADPITDVVFPAESSALFLTASKRDIRLWNAETRMELLRIQVPNLTCLCLALARDGKSIVSGWDDGKIRAFAPESGKLQYVIPDAHADAVTALTLTSNGARIVSGGRDGRVRVWNVSGRTQVMEVSFKEHKKAVTHIALTRDDTEAVTSAEDGSCIVWNLVRGVRANALFASTMFRSVLYHPDESQLLTVGSDRKLSYWDASDCSAIRVIDGSTAEITTADIEPDGVVVATGGRDKLVKVWVYDEGIHTHTGAGHSGAVARLRISPDQTCIVSVGEEGAIFMWTMPPMGAVDMIAGGYVPKAGMTEEEEGEGEAAAAAEGAHSEHKADVGTGAGL